MLNLNKNLHYGNKLQVINFMKKIVDRIIKIGLKKKGLMLKEFMEKELEGNLMKGKCISEWSWERKGLYRYCVFIRLFIFLHIYI